MKFDIYCDECFPDLLTSKNPQAEFVIIGGLWIPRERRESLKQQIHDLRDTHKIGGEIKSRKVSPSRLSFYRELIDLYLNKGHDVRFRAIAIDRKLIDLSKFHEDSAELSFYKFYYQLLHHWLLPNADYQVFCDYQTNQEPGRLHELRQVLKSANPLTTFSSVQWVRSKESVLTQLSDVITGLVSARLNETPQAGSAKSELLNYLESKLGRPIAGTSVSEKKLNVFAIRLNEQW